MQIAIRDCAEQFLKCYFFRGGFTAAWMGSRTYGEEDSSEKEARKDELPD